MPNYFQPQAIRKCPERSLTRTMSHWRPPAAGTACSACAYERRQGNMRDDLANFEESLGNFGKSLTGIVETQTAHTNALNLPQRTDHLKKIHESGLVANLESRLQGSRKSTPPLWRSSRWNTVPSWPSGNRRMTSTMLLGLSWRFCAFATSPTDCQSHHRQFFTYYMRFLCSNRQSLLRKLLLQNSGGLEINAEATHMNDRKRIDSVEVGQAGCAVVQADSRSERV